MCKLILNLQGSLQSWGDSNKSWNRTTIDHPTKSGVLGMVCSALGISMKKEPGKVQEISKKIKMDVVVVEQGEPLRDFQTLGTNYDHSDPFEKRAVLCKLKSDGTIGQKADCPSKIFTKDYLYGAHFLVVLETDTETATMIQDAFQNPKWPVYLGRRCCMPSAPVGMGIKSIAEVRELVGKIAGEEVVIFKEDSEGMPYMDEPLGGLKYGVRYVSEKTVQVQDIL